MKTLFGLFVIAHGLIHGSYLTPKPNDPNYPFRFDSGWFASLVGAASQPIGVALAVIVVASFGLAGLGLLGIPRLENSWRLMIVIGAGGSTLLLALYWHAWLLLGFAINLVILVGVFKFSWF